MNRSIFGLSKCLNQGSTITRSFTDSATGRRPVSALGETPGGRKRVAGGLPFPKMSVLSKMLDVWSGKLQREPNLLQPTSALSARANVVLVRPPNASGL